MTIKILLYYIENPGIFVIGTTNPNSLTYFFGLLIVILIQFLVIADYFRHYADASPYLMWTKWVNIQYFIKKYKLQPVSFREIKKYYWLVSFTVLFFELLFCAIAYLLNKSLLFMSISLWSVCVFESWFCYVYISEYLKNTEDLKVALNIRENQIFTLDMKISAQVPFWRTEEMIKHGEAYNESILEQRIKDYRTVRVRAITTLAFQKESIIVDIMDNGDAYTYTETVLQALSMPGQYHSINILLYVCYVYICSKDSIFLYNIFYFWGLVNQIDGYNPNITFLQVYTYNNIIVDLDPKFLEYFLVFHNYHLITP